MDVLDAGDQLIGQEEDRLQGEFPVAEIEQILQAGSEEVEHHGVVVTFRSEPTDEGDADASGQRLVHACLVFQLWVFSFHAFQLDGDFFSGDNIGAW